MSSDNRPSVESNHGPSSFPAALVEKREAGATSAIASTTTVNTFHSARDTMPDAPLSESPIDHTSPPRTPPAAVLNHPLANDSIPALLPAEPPRPPSPQNAAADLPVANTGPRPTHPIIPLNSWIGRVLLFFGYGNRTRKQLISIIWTTFIDCGELIAILVLLPLSAHLASPTAAPKNEWDACSKPLGAWNAIWTVRAVVDLILAYTTWTTQRKKRMNPTSEEAPPADNTNAGTGADNTVVAAALGDGNGTQGEQPAQEGNGGARRRNYPAWQARLSAISTIFTFAWFILAHIFVYTSVDSCRLSSPHIWWLTFALLCVMYISVIEVLLIALIVFIVGPLIALGITIILILMGRHPIQTANQIRPDINKLPKEFVDLIPLVVFIPPPPDEPVTSPIAIPAPALSYPPTPKPAPQPKKKPRFRFLRRKTKKVSASGGDADAEKGTDDDDFEEPRTWEDRWEKSDYPFVRLEENRATCAVCMEDFVEPHRRGGAKATSTSPGVGSEPPRSPVVEDASAIRLEDAGEGAQPLRLLACGHVFHQTCLDPWLTGVSGRCPTCQRPVEFSPEQIARANGRGSRRRRRRQDRSP
ncbi:hypothetical protein PENSPDRAFT_755353 [Peniophora sp. CONT]|nr:hypothetical protein PENSPDRAFT_755353 [Peniophora sp. CONT]